MKTLNVVAGVAIIVALTAPAYGWLCDPDPNVWCPEDSWSFDTGPLTTMSSATATTGGADVWGSWDQFHYTYAMPDDGGGDLFVHHLEIEIAADAELGTTYYWRIDEVNSAPFEPVDLSLGDAMLGTSTRVVVSVRNVGDEVLTLDAVLTGDECFAIESRGSGSVDSMQIVEIELLFTPRSVRDFSGVLEINGAAVVTVTGTGVLSTRFSAQDEVAKIGEAVKALEEALAVGTLGIDEAFGLMDQLTDLAGKVAFNVVLDAEIAATAAGANADVMAEAWLFWEAGKLLQVAGEYPQAVAMYDCAVARAKANRRSTVKAQDL
jgi:hypothetical protein